MRIAAFIIPLLFAQVGWAQLIVKPIPRASDQIISVSPTNKVVTQPSTLPFWDDFSVSNESPDSIRIWGTDTATQWNYHLSKNTLVNSTLALNPPTYNVVTFDGLDANGNFHGAVGDVGLTDELVSDTIALQGTANVVLSFFWQAGGQVEIPEAGDSLVLQFYLPEATNPWQTVWLKDGGDLEPKQDSIFTQESIAIPAVYLTNQFMFRFQSYGDQDGPFDAWHLDWIYLNESRGNEDFYYLDRGLTGQLTSPLAPFKSMPTSQFTTNSGAFTDSQFIQAFNLDNQPQPTEYILVIRDLNSGIKLDSIEYGAEDPLLSNPDPMQHSVERFIELDGIDLSSLATEDSLVLQSEVYLKSSDDDLLDGTSVNLRVNDTARVQYLLHDYYAYDDGTAEYAVGTDINGGQVAIKFWLEVQDTLTHIDIHFPNINPPSASSSIQLRVFKDLDDDPIRIQNTTVINSDGVNAFTRYTLTSPLVISDTFYIGYQQSKNEYIGVGFDRSNPDASAHIYENQTGEWEQNVRLSGAMMIRPVFQTLDSLLTGVKLTEKVIAYPNPVDQFFTIKGHYEGVTLMDFSGRVILKEASKPLHDLTKFQGGIYLLIIHRKEGDQTLKMIKK